jgi:5-methylcytosine-specific restriction endonuclease McrA
MKPLKKPRRKRDKIDPNLVFARRLRQNLRARAKSSEHLEVEDVPSADDLYTWLKSQTPLTCYYTNRGIKLSEVNIDHKTPVSLGGTNDISNLCVCHKSVNKAKGSFTEAEFFKLLSVFEGNAKEYLMSRLRRGFICARKGP